jgi:hypothetical protein
MHDVVDSMSIASLVVACVSVIEAGLRYKETRTFGATTRELLLLRQWLVEVSCSHMGMESTGVELLRFWRREEEKYANIKSGGFHEQNTASLHERIQATGRRAFQNQWKE